MTKAYMDPPALDAKLFVDEEEQWQGFVCTKKNYEKTDMSAFQAFLSE